jgi:DNA-3-methyladenine glycosylase
MGNVSSSPQPEALGLAFYARDTRVVAKALLGKLLFRRRGDQIWTGRIVETEAYHGPDDRASHGHGGPTPRSAIMFGPAGKAYVYLIYGMHCCLNITTGDKIKPSAVLLRALAPVAGRRFPSDDPRAAAGPGKLCRAFGIDRADNHADVVTGPDLWLADDGSAAPKIARGPRIGVDYAGEWAEKPWRFWVKDDIAISKRPPRNRSSPPRG